MQGIAVKLPACRARFPPSTVGTQGLGFRALLGGSEGLSK